MCLQNSTAQVFRTEAKCPSLFDSQIPDHTECNPTLHLIPKCMSSDMSDPIRRGVRDETCKLLTNASSRRPGMGPHVYTIPFLVLPYGPAHSIRKRVRSQCFHVAAHCTKTCLSGMNPIDPTFDVNTWSLRACTHRMQDIMPPSSEVFAEDETRQPLLAGLASKS